MEEYSRIRITGGGEVGARSSLEISEVRGRTLGSDEISGSLGG